LAQSVWKPRILAGCIVLGWLYLLTHQSEGSALILVRYSSRYALAVGLYFVITMGGVFVLLTRPQVVFAPVSRLVSRWPVWITILVLVVTTAIWALPVESPLKLFPTILLFGILLAASDLFVMSTPSPRWRIVLLMLLGGILLAQLLVLTAVPTWHSHDEGAYTLMAVRAIDTGRLGGDIYGYPERAWIGFGSWLYTLGIWLNSVGFSWWSARLYAFVLGIVSLSLLYAAGRVWIGKSGALAAVLFMAASGMFVETHRARPDAITIMGVCSSLWAFGLAWRDRKPWQFMLTGFVGALTLEAHLAAVVFPAAYGVVLGMKWVREGIRTHKVSFPWFALWMALGALGPLLIFWITHLLPDAGKPSGLVLSPEPFNLVGYLTKEAERWVEYLSSFTLEGVILLIAIGVGIWRGRQRMSPLLITLVLAAALYIFAVPRSWSQYTLYFLPLFSLIIGSLFSEVYVRRLNVIALAALLAGISGPFLYKATRSLPVVLERNITQVQKPPIVAFIESAIPTGEAVVIDMVYALSFDHPTNYRIINAMPHPPTIEMLGGPAASEYFTELSPAVIVFDPRVDDRTEHLQAFLESTSYYENLSFSGLTVYIRPDFVQHNGDS
jgi:hypothetical protein